MQLGLCSLQAGLLCCILPQAQEAVREKGQVQWPCLHMPDLDFLSFRSYHEGDLQETASFPWLESRLILARPGNILMNVSSSQFKMHKLKLNMARMLHK